ncbi:MAG: KOW motif-containing protein, partial [Pseudomonadota bacterium]|nr:KOW motif-containing protein [Pseudomonadota bacterium]
MVAKIKKGDRVLVMAGRDKGKAGEVLAVNCANTTNWQRGQAPVTTPVAKRRRCTLSSGGRLHPWLHPPPDAVVADPPHGLST